MKNHFTGLVTLAGFMLLPANAIAQSTPSDLANMSLEELLNVQVADSDDSEKLRKWTVGVAWQKLDIGGYKSGTNDLSFQDVLFAQGEVRTNTNFPVVPTYITQEVVSFNASYQLNEAVNLNINIPHISQSTDHISSVPGFDEFVLKSEGWGDIALSASWAKDLKPNRTLTLSGGFTLPTGSINETGDTPRNGAGTDERLPYTMQLGSGTLDGFVSAHIRQDRDKWSVSGGGSAIFRTGENDHNYRLGNAYRLSARAQYEARYWFKPGVELDYRHISQIEGADTSLMIPGPFPYPASITDPSNYGSDKVSLSARITSCLDESCHISVIADYSQPLYQHLQGVQPKERDRASISLTARF